MKRPLFASSGLWKLGQIGALTLGLSIAATPQSGCDRATNDVSPRPGVEAGSETVSGVPGRATSQNLASLPKQVRRTPKTKSPDPVSASVSADSSTKDSDFRFEFFGCTVSQDTKEGSVCWLAADAQLRLWTNRSCNQVRVVSDGRPVPVETAMVQQGCQIRVLRSSQEQLGSSTLQVLNTDTGAIEGSLAVDYSKPHLLELSRRTWERPGADLAESLAFARRVASRDGDADLQLDARLTMALGNYRIGQISESISQLRQVIPLAERLGYRSVILDAVRRILFMLTYVGSNSEAWQVLEQYEPLLQAGDARNYANILWQKALLYRSEDRFDLAIPLVSKALDAMERVDDRSFQIVALPIYLEMLVTNERKAAFVQILPLVRRLVASSQSPCEKATLLGGIALTGLTLVDGTETAEALLSIDGPSVRNLFEAAIANRLQCIDSGTLANLYLGLSRLELAEQKTTEATRWLKLARSQIGIGAPNKADAILLETEIYIMKGQANLAQQTLSSIEQVLNEAPTSFRQFAECRVAALSVDILSQKRLPATLDIDRIRSCLSNANSLLPPSFRKRLEGKLAEQTN